MAFLLAVAPPGCSGLQQGCDGAKDRRVRQAKPL
jgi:hypothetical protein